MERSEQEALASRTSALVSHYLDHIQPVIDELAAADSHLFVGLDPSAAPEECAESSEHSIERMEAFVRFQSRITAEVDAWCLAQGFPDDLLQEALNEAARAEAEGRETNGTILLELLASVNDYGTYAGYMAGEAEQLSEPPAPPPPPPPAPE
eukprot:TRINITY_DN96663_c0_g1_i1.p1 TRINITY_DN96663_c0_g1~~TRINITY_DN96663_c0_g1_i1.p1  ORF type:complete len:170 (-),score=49.53 TRINITY_DN96663_c0_g1_i1:167-622(-)